MMIKERQKIAEIIRDGVTYSHQTGSVLIHGAIDEIQKYYLSKMKKTTHGGARKGAGRKPNEPTKVIRVPVSLVPKVEKLIQQHSKKRINGKL